MDKKYVITIIASVIVLLGAGLFTLNAVQSSDIDEQLKAADIAFENGDFEKSLDLYNAVLKLDKGTLRARLGVAKSHFALENWDAVEEVLLSGININPKEASYYINLADFHIFRGNIERAVMITDRGIGATNHAELHELLEFMERNIHIHMELSTVQKGYSKPVEVIWKDEHDRLIPLEVPLQVKNSIIGNIVNEKDEVHFFAKEIGTTTITGKLQSIEVDLEVSVQEQVLSEIAVYADGNLLNEQATIEILKEEEILLTAKGLDYAGEIVELSPSWRLENELGSLSQSTGHEVSFIAASDGVEIITISYEGIEREVRVIIDGNNKYITYEFTGEGTVEITPDQESFVIGSEIIVKAIPSEGWEFVEWSGDISGSTNPLTLIMDDHKHLEAKFERVTHELRTNRLGEGDIIFSSLAASFKHGDSVTLTARPADGWKFDGWTGSVYNSSSTISMIMDSAKSITAIFVRDETYNNNTNNTGSTNSTENNTNHSNSNNNSNSNTSGSSNNSSTNGSNTSNSESTNNGSGNSGSNNDGTSGTEDGSSSNNESNDGGPHNHDGSGNGNDSSNNDDEGSNNNSND